MAAITTLQVESITSADNELLWTNINSAQTKDIHRSIDNFVASDVTIAAAIVASSAGYSDLTPVAGTRYWYKVVEAAGTSNVVNVVTQVCAVLGSQPQPGVTMPQLNDPLTANQINQLIDQLNQTLGGTNNPFSPCTVCSTHGSLILDCTSCNNFVVEMSEDINSISMIGCSGTGGGSGSGSGGGINLTLTVPPNGSFNVAGFPKGSGADPGKTLLNGGSAGTDYSVPFNKNPGGPTAQPGGGSGTSGGGGGGGGGGGSLKLTCQTPTGGANTSCSIDCGTLKKIRMVASGGVLPYAYSVTGGLTQAAIAFDTTDLTPPANTGSGTAGTAYSTHWQFCDGAFIEGAHDTFGCNDNFLGLLQTGGCTFGTYVCSDGLSSGKCAPRNCFGSNSSTCSGFPGNTAGGDCSAGGSGGVMQSAKLDCDRRDAGMIAANCNPCGVSSAGKVFTVTDGTGTSVSKTINV